MKKCYEICKSCNIQFKCNSLRVVSEVFLETHNKLVVKKDVNEVPNDCPHALKYMMRDALQNNKIQETMLV